MKCGYICCVGFGHYTATARDWREVDDHHDGNVAYEPDTAFGPWHYYDDESVQLINKPGLDENTRTPFTNEVDEIIKSNQAYILFYRLRDPAL